MPKGSFEQVTSCGAHVVGMGSCRVTWADGTQSLERYGGVVLGTARTARVGQLRANLAAFRAGVEERLEWPSADGHPARAVTTVEWVKG